MLISNASCRFSHACWRSCPPRPFPVTWSSSLSATQCSSWLSTLAKTSPHLCGHLFWLIHSYPLQLCRGIILSILCLYVQAHLQSLVLEWQGCPESVPLSRNVAHTLHLVGVAVAWRKGSRLTETEKVIKMAETVLSPSNPHLSVPLLSVALRLVTSLLLVSTTVAECHAHFPRLLRLLCVRGEGQEEVAKVLECFRELAEKHPHFATVSPFKLHALVSLSEFEYTLDKLFLFFPLGYSS